MYPNQPNLPSQQTAYRTTQNTPEAQGFDDITARQGFRSCSHESKRLHRQDVGHPV